MKSLPIYEDNNIKIIRSDIGVMVKDTKIKYMLMEISFAGLYTYSGVRNGLFDGGICGRLFVVGVDEL